VKDFALAVVFLYEDTKETVILMKTPIPFILCLTVLVSTSGLGQPPAAPAPSQPLPQRRVMLPPGVGQPAETPQLTKFSLDFPGGTPQELVAAIEKATGKPLNAIIAEEHANFRLPPIRLSSVTVPELFSALLQGSYKYRYYDNGPRTVISSYGFETDAKPPSDDSIWRFYSYSAPEAARTGPTKFDLDFPGGTPKEFVAAIQKAMGKPLNAIIPEEDADIKLPPLKMNNVNVPQLFAALQLASIKRVGYVTSNYGLQSQYQQMTTSYGFKTAGSETDDSVWYFYAEKPTFPPLIQNKACRFYSLAPYLERGLTVDDVTTAIQTGWKMLGDKDTPAISFHKDTKLLIAVGEPGKLETIDAVLKALEPPKPAPVPAAAQSKPAGKPGGSQKPDE
jgi:hypothetical protein